VNTETDAVWVAELRKLLEKDGENAFYPDIRYRRSTPSTNDWLKEAVQESLEPAQETVREEQKISDADEGTTREEQRISTAASDTASGKAAEGTVVIADEQTAGKGRSGRIWVSPSGRNIYFSLLLTPDIKPEKATALTLAMGLSVAQGIRTALSLPAYIKWPNDIIVNKKKVCGMLTEMEVRGSQIKAVIIGVGINVNQKEFPEEIAFKASSLMLEKAAGDASPMTKKAAGDASPMSEKTAKTADSCEKELSRAEILAGVLTAFHENYKKFLETENLEGLKEDYNALLFNVGRAVRIEDPKGAYTAVSRGIDEKGRLAVEREDGSTVLISTGEISVRGLYGYV